jgi:hypothetical protein
MACNIDRVKHWTRILDWAVITALSVLIAAAMALAAGQLRAGEVDPQTQTAPR